MADRRRFTVTILQKISANENPEFCSGIRFWSGKIHKFSGWDLVVCTKGRQMPLRVSRPFDKVPDFDAKFIL